MIDGLKIGIENKFGKEARVYAEGMLNKKYSSQDSKNLINLKNTLWRNTVDEGLASQWNSIYDKKSDEVLDQYGFKGYHDFIHLKHVRINLN